MLSYMPRPRVHRFILGLAFAAFATTVATFGASAADAPTLVQIDSGKVQGTAAHGVIAFKGIPFVQPPVGVLRWRAPQPVVPWQGVLEASGFRSDCVQPLSKGTSEDCLYANVWRPASAADKPLPVMVWIYGGGLVRGGRRSILETSSPVRASLLSLSTIASAGSGFSRTPR